MTGPLRSTVQFPSASPTTPREGSPLRSGDPLADSILDSIALGTYRVGDRLPAEVELAKHFGVAVATLRKSLAVLREHQVVETRRGRKGGTFILSAPFPTDQMVRDHLASRSIVDLRDYADEHATVSAGIARLACQRRSDRTIAQLRQTSARLLDASTLADQAAADSRFHLRLAAASQSSRLLAAETRLQSEICNVLWSGAGGSYAVAQAMSEHEEILRHMEAGDCDAAAAAAEEQVRRAAHRLIDAKLTHQAAQEV